jgi:hypothetical protein
MTIGVRAAFFVPAELPAAWTFRTNGPSTARAYWRATRASMIALVAPTALFITAIVTTPLVGWRVAAWHAAFVLIVLVALVDVIALTIDHVPFTRPYSPGHARLKTRWPLYVIGMLLAAYWSVRLELRAMGGAEPTLLGWTLAVALAAHLAGWRRARTWSVEPREEDLLDEGSGIAVLDIGAVRA